MTRSILNPTKPFVALVTGSSRGIGAAVAVRLADTASAVVVNCRSDMSAAAEVVARVRAQGCEATAIRADVSLGEEVDRLFTEVEAKYGAVTVLVNNAGRIPQPSGWSQLTDDGVADTLRQNLASVILCTQRAAPQMQRQGWGRVISIGSTYAMEGTAAILAYAAAKAGVTAVTRGLALELASSGVTVNEIAPSNVDTEMTRGGGDEFVALVQERTPAGRLGEAEEIADAISYLIDAPYVTGHQLVVDGGFSLRPRLQSISEELAGDESQSIDIDAASQQ